MKEGKGNLLTDLLFTGWFAALLGGGEGGLWCVPVMMGLGLGLLSKNPFQAGLLGFSGIGGQTSGSALGLFSTLELSLSHLLIIFIKYLPINLPAISRQYYLSWKHIDSVYMFLPIWGRFDVPL